MSLAKFQRVCAKNVSGCQALYVAEQANVTALTVTSGEISAVTGADAFKEIEADIDSINWETSSEKVGLAGIVYRNTISWMISKMRLAMNTLREALADGSPCGFLAIVTDGNAQNWLVGYSENDLKNRPLRLQTETGKTGQGLTEAEGNVMNFSLQNECGGLVIPFDSNTNADINAGTADYIDYQT
jgi:hypothetical protein